MIIYNMKNASQLVIGSFHSLLIAVVYERTHIYTE